MRLYFQFYPPTFIHFYSPTFYFNQAPRPRCGEAHSTGRAGGLTYRPVGREKNFAGLHLF